MNKVGTVSTGGTTYDLSAAEDWATGVDTSINVADTGNSIAVTGLAAPAIFSSTYDFNSNQLALSGARFLKRSGAANDIDVSTLTVTGEGGATYTLSSSVDVEITNSSSAVITLTGLDIRNVEALLNKDGTTSASNGTTYNLAAAEDWNIGADAAVNIADATASITVSNFANPAITSATYDASTGALVVTGTNFVVNSGASNDVDASLLTLRGGANETYTLTDSGDVEITSETQFTVTLSTTDRRHVNGVLNKNGTTSGSATIYNLEAADNWMTGSPAGNSIADTTGNGITVSNTQTPTITSATYDSTTGIFSVTGTNLVHKPGAANDIDLSLITITGEGGNYTLTTTTDVEITDATSFTFTVSGADKTAVDAKLDQLGTTSSGNTTYNIAVADDWLTGADASANIADTTGNVVTVTVPPVITSSTYNATTGVLVVTGANFEANGGGSDVDASTLTFTGEGGQTYTLTDTADVERDSITQFTLTLSATDKAAVNLIMNRNGTSATGSTTYNLAAADDYITASTAGNTADSTNGVTVSGVAAPTITSATYDASNGALMVTGTGFLKRSGATNDIDASTLTLAGEGGETYTLTDTADVEITSGTSFTVTLSATDRAAAGPIINRNGTTSTGGTPYNLAVAEDWNTGADAAVAIADGTGNGITVSNVPVPAITGATYNFGTGTLAVTGSGFVKSAGASNDIDVSAMTITGVGRRTYTLASSADVEIASGTLFTITLSANDRAQVNTLMDGNGARASDNTVYNLAAAEDWAAGAAAAVAVADPAGNGITVSGVPAAESEDDRTVIDIPTDNGGVLTDITITETGTVDGGTLEGNITSDGHIQNVTLSGGATVTGGTLSGEITGDAANPAVINSTIQANTVLNNVVIGAGSTVDPSARLGRNVRFESVATIPQGLDLTGTLDPIPWTQEPDQVVATNLNNSLLSGTGPESITLLRSIQLLSEYEPSGNRVEQNPDTGELVLDTGSAMTTLLPVTVIQAPAGAQQGTFYDEDGNIVFITTTGQQVLSYPALSDVETMRTSLRNPVLQFDNRANIVVTPPRTPDMAYMARPDVISLPAHRGSSPGFQFYEQTAPAKVPGVSLIYEDGNGQLMEQDIFPVPADWPSLKARLGRIGGAESVSIGTDGVISVVVNGITFKALSGYLISKPSAAESGPGNVQFSSVGDLNGDGTADLIVTFPNGDMQKLYILP